nr:hypothetical protein [Actinomycetota bacterium]
GFPEHARALAVRGGSRAAQGDPRGLDDVRRAIEISRGRNDSLQLARTLNNYAIDVYPYEGPAASLAVSEELLDLAERRGLARSARAATGTRLDAQLALGRWDELEVVAKEFLEVPVLSEWERFWLHISLAEILAHRGEAQRSVALTDGLVESARAFGEGQALMASLCVNALVAAGAGDLASARRHLLELEDVDGLREQWNFPLYLPGAVRTALVVSEAGLAQRLVGALRDTTPLHRHGRRAVEAALAEADGELDRAASGYSDAAAEWGNFGNVLEQAFALRGLGRCLLGLGQRAEALEALAGARALFSGFEAHPYVREIDDLLGDESVVTEAS